MSVDLTADEQFFFDHAGYSHPTGDDPEQARVAAALLLAAAERAYRAGPYYSTVTPDLAADRSEGYDGPVWMVTLWTFGKSASGVDDEWLDALGGVECESEADPQIRVIVAEMALSALPPYPEFDADDRCIWCHAHVSEPHDPQCITESRGVA